MHKQIEYERDMMLKQLHRIDKKEYLHHRKITELEEEIFAADSADDFRAISHKLDELEREIEREHERAEPPAQRPYEGPVW